MMNGDPSGSTFCDTYSFNTPHGTLYIGHYHYPDVKRWWIPIVLEEQIKGMQLPIAFEMCIPEKSNMNLSVHYAIDSNQKVSILHKGKFSVGHRSVSMAEFFDYYRKNPGKWKIIDFNYHDYLILENVNLVLTDADFQNLLISMAEFAKYIPKFREKYRK